MRLTAATAHLDRRLDATAGAPLAVAYSGGGDSLALLLATLDWARTRGREVMALHVDHGLQRDSATWAALAERTALAAGARFRRLTWEGPKPATGRPAAARAARLALMAQAVRDLGATVLLLGHTADDVAEADWMRARGLPLGRLQAWSPSPVWPQGRGVFHLRPLIDQRRSELREELARGGHTWIEDPANDDLAYTRARARRALAGGGAGASAPEGGPSNPDMDQPVTFSSDRAGAIRLDRRDLGRVPYAARAALGMAVTCASGMARPVRTRVLEPLADRLSGPDEVVATIGGARVWTAEREIVIGRAWGRPGAPRASIRIAPGEGTVWDGRFILRTDEPGWRVLPLAGHAARLSRTEQARLRAAPPALRPTLPVVVKEGETLTCPILAHGQVKALSLAGARMRAAMGQVQTESQAMALAHGEEGSEDLSSGPAS